jgi:hypothetical protein
VCAGIDQHFERSAQRHHSFRDSFAGFIEYSVNGPGTVQDSLQFQPGYNVRASLNSFTVTPSSPASGGATISPSDIAVAITFVDTSGSGVQQPRVDTIAYGFNYNPGGVTASNGIASFTGVASGQATLADLNATKILSGPRIASSQNSSSTTNFIMVTITFGVLREYFTPASLTAVVGLTMSDGQ